MELVYITRAIRRYWWVVALGAVVGILAGVALGGGGGSVYETQARVLIAPPSDAGFGGTSNDRYVQNQILVFDSAALAESVADAVGDISPADARGAAAFAQVPNSDIVTVTVTASTPELAQGIANAYVEAYFDAIRSQLDDTQAPDLEEINNAIAEVESALAEVDAEIQIVLGDYEGPVGVALPTIDQVSPALDTQRQVLLDQYFQLVASRNEMELGTRTRIGTQVVQRAGLPTVPNAQGFSLLLVAAPMAGLMLGSLAAVTIARISPVILDDDEAETILAVPVAATIPSVRALHATRTSLDTPMPTSVTAPIHELCVRAEASQVSGEALVVVVAGADQHAGTTTLALAMAKRFGATGSQVLLVDADRGDPELTALAGEAVSGIRLLLSDDQARNTPSGRSERNRPLHPYARTVLQGVRFAGWGDSPSAHGLRRQDVAALVARAAEHAQVVVVDAGTLMDAASSVQLAQLADVVVLTLPVRRQRRSALQVASGQLIASRGGLLPVVTAAVVPKTARAASHEVSTPAADAESDRDAVDSSTAS